MKIRLRGEYARKLPKVLRAAHWTTLCVSAAFLAFPVFVTVESSYAQWSGKRMLSLQQSPVTEKEQIIPEKAPTVQTARGAVLGQFEMPRLKLSWVLLEGADGKTLEKSIGHVEGSSEIGEAGNIGIAGHRDTHFRKLEWVRRGDVILLRSRNHREYRYQVEWARLYKPADLEVLDPSHGPAVTLITCFPFE